LADERGAAAGEGGAVGVVLEGCEEETTTVAVCEDEVEVEPSEVTATCVKSSGICDHAKPSSPYESSISTSSAVAAFETVTSFACSTVTSDDEVETARASVTAIAGGRAGEASCRRRRRVTPFAGGMMVGTRGSM
jgi:hypothetical protein